MNKILIVIILFLSLCACANRTAQTKITKAKLYYNKGLECNMRLDDRTAILYYDSAISLYHDVNFFNNRGLSKYQLGDTIGALADYNFAIHLDRLHFTTVTNLANYYYDRKDHKTALKYYERSSQINDKQSIFDIMGHCEYLLGNYQKALTYYEKHLKGRNPLYPEFCIFRMGNCYEKLGDMEAARQYWGKAAALGEEEAKQKLDSIK